MFGAGKEVFVVAEETLSRDDFAQTIERMYRHPEAKTYLFTPTQRSNEIIRDAINKGVITLGSRERRWYKMRRGGFIRIGPYDDPPVRLASLGMYTRQRIFLTDSERNRRDAQKERPSNLIISVFDKFSKHYHEHEDWYYLLGLVLSIAGIAVSFR